MNKEQNLDKSNENLQRYELVYLISNKFSADELEPITGSVIKLIKDNGGEIILEENWGKKKLAYPIQHFYHAYYQLVEFDLLKEAQTKLEKHLRLAEEIIRHLIVKKRIKTKEEIEQEKLVAKKITEEKKEELEKEEKPRPKSKSGDDKKVSMEELDEKLDKILDDTDNLI